MPKRRSSNRLKGNLKDQKESCTSHSETELIDSVKTESSTSPKKLKSSEMNSPSSYEKLHSNDIKTKFLLDMPEDFYHLWEFCNSIDSEKPECALEKSLNLVLGGPYDILTGKLKNAEVDDCLCYDRYFFDPPEFQTIIKGDSKTQFHLGYYRDDPKQMPIFVASNAALENCSLVPVARTVFGALNCHIVSLIKSSSSKKKDLESLKKLLTDFSESKSINLDVKSVDMKDREKKVVAKTFHGAGIVVPLDKNDVGYREIPETYAKQRNIFTAVANSDKDKVKASKSRAELDELMTLIQFANDECDFGMGLELGLNLFSFGHESFNSMISYLLPMAYNFLKRKEFAEIAKAFLKRRKYIL